MPIGGARGGSKLAVWDGLIVISNPEGNSLAALDPANGTVLRLGMADGSPLALNGPTGLAVGPNDELYVVDSADNRVVVLKDAGGR